MLSAVYARKWIIGPDGRVLIDVPWLLRLLNDPWAAAGQPPQGIPDGAEEPIPSVDMEREGRVEGISASVDDGARGELDSGDEGTRPSPSVLIESGDDGQG